MKKFIVHLLILILVAITPFATIVVIGLCQTNKYTTSFYAGLVVKDDRLTKAEGKKIVFLGGSSLSFGLRSDMLSKATGYEVVDYGLYAPLGVKTMAELADNKINKGDIVIFAPEISSETYSTKMDYQMLLKCVEDKPSMLNRLTFDDMNTVLYNYPAFVFERFKAEVNLQDPYSRDSFNEYGDISSAKVVQNIMPSLYDSAQLVAPNTDLLNKEFINYVNSYIKKMNKKGADVYFTFSPTNQLALVEEQINAFESSLKESIDCEVLGSVKEFTYDEHYFFDTNYHLNYAGSVIHSENLADLICEQLETESKYEFPEVEMPPAIYDDIPDPEPEPTPEPEPEPEPSSSEIPPEDSSASESSASESSSSESESSSSESSSSVIPEKDLYITKTLGTRTLLTGLHESLHDEEVIWIPQQVDGKTISGVNANAFKDMTNLKVVILPDTIDSLDNNIFNGCSALEKLYLTNSISPSFVGNGLFDGANASVKLYVIDTALSSYTTGYTWTHYLSKLRTFKMSDLDIYR